MFKRSIKTLMVIGCMLSFFVTACRSEDEQVSPGSFSSQFQDLPSAPKPDTAFSASVFLSEEEPDISIIPKPVALTQNKGSFVLTKNARIILLADSLKKSATYLNDYLNKYYGFKLKVKKGVLADTAAYNAIILGNREMAEPLSGGYTFLCSGNRILIQGKDAAGTFYGMQTLIQLLPTTPADQMNIPHVEMTDYPRFQHRSVMLDCGRHFFPVSFVKKVIDYAALHKMNIFHWHLTEDQGWRIQIKQYPKLTEIGGTRNPKQGDHNYSGFFTQEQIREVVKYAQERYVTIIPEIEMPGHSLAAIASYPQLTCAPGNYHVANTGGVYSPVLCPTPYTFDFYKNVLDEVMDLFPSHYIHIGGDEAPTSTWQNSAYCQQLMQEKGMTNVREIQSYFIKTMEKYLNAHGRDIIGWDEILEGGLAPNATVQSWRGESGGIAAANQHHHVIMSPQAKTYISQCQTSNSDTSCPHYLPIKRVYDYNPTANFGKAQAKYVIGVEACLWAEHIQWTTTAEYMLFPRLEAVAEIAWTPNDEKNYSDFQDRLMKQYRRYDLWGTDYYKQ